MELKHYMALYRLYETKAKLNTDIGDSVNSFNITVHVPINFFFVKMRANPESKVYPVLEITFRSSSLKVLNKLLPTTTF